MRTETQKSSGLPAPRAFPTFDGVNDGGETYAFQIGPEMLGLARRPASSGSREEVGELCKYLLFPWG